MHFYNITYSHVRNGVKVTIGKFFVFFNSYHKDETLQNVHVCLSTVTDVELKRLKDAFKRTSGLSAYMTQQCFYKEVLGDGVPPKVAEVNHCANTQSLSLSLSVLTTSTTKILPTSQPTCFFQSHSQPTTLLVCHCCKCFVNNKLPA